MSTPGRFTQPAYETSPASGNPRPGTFYALGALVTGMFFLIFLRLLWFQVSPEFAEWRTFARTNDREALVAERLPVPRGWILDREGRVLAGSRRAYQLDIAPDALRRPGEVVTVLAGILDLDPKTLWERLAPPEDDAVLPAAVAIAYDVTPEQREALLQWWRRWRAQGENSPIDPTRNDVFRFTPVMLRVYPESDLAPNVLGLVNLSATASETRWEGHYGVEGYYDALLQQSWVQVPFYAPYDLTPEEIALPEPVPGLVLTLDRDIQYMAERILDDARETYDARRGVILIMDPRTGALLAVAMSPRPKLDDPDSVLAFLREFQGEGWDWAIHHAYEPGSVIKPIILAIALDSGAIEPDFVYHDTGVEEPCGPQSVVYNWDYQGHGEQTLVGCLALSLNTCFANIAMQIPRGTLLRYLEAFGFGDYTGVDLDVEMRGFFSVANCVDQSRVGFGHAISVTPLQLAAAEAVLANGGYLVKPHLIQGQVLNGRYSPAPYPQVVRQVIRPEVARQVTDFLAQAMATESFENAVVEGYTLAGKTGTAYNDKIPNDLLDATMVGWGPVDDPRFLVVVWLEDPKNGQWASMTAAPTFRRVVQRLVVMMGIPPEGQADEDIAQTRP
ncbi:MAG: penicillin-binding protein 2 [Chloroflexi bacterium]|nr:penicillin-binding protein 2 [Chloroflexota bacterium]